MSSAGRRRQLRKPRSNRSLSVETFEPRLLMTAVVVNSTADVVHTRGAVISLRDAIAKANAATSATSISFDPTVFAAAQTITLINGLFELSNTHAATTITGPSAALILNANNTLANIQIDGGVTASISNVTFTKGASGAFENSGNLTLDHVTLTGNSSTGAAGPAIDVTGGGTLTGNNLTVTNNTDSSGGSGAITNTGKVTIRNSTFSGNVSSNQAGTINTRFGGTVTVVNDTFFDNACGGLQFDFSGTGFVYDCTFVGNAWGLYVNNNDATNSCAVANTIVAATTNGDTFGLFKSQGGNLIGDPNGQGLTSSGWIASDQLGSTAHPLSPKLGAPANNGGPTQTMLPLAGSPALNKGVNAKVPSGTTTDQRGFSRIQGTAVDVGAVEVQPPPLITVTPPPAQTGKLNTAVSVTLGSFTQTGGLAPFKLDLAWGDGSADSIINLTTAGTIPATTHAFARSGPITVSETITDAAGAKSNKATFIENVPSTAVIKITPPASQTATAGVSKSVPLGSFTGIGATGPYKLEVDWGDGSAKSVLNLTTVGTIPAIAHTYSSAGVNTVSEALTDIDGNKSAVATFTDTVTAAAGIKITPPASQVAKTGVNTNVTLGSFTQTGATGPFKVNISWGDGSAETVLTANAAGTIPATAHTFIKTGALVVTETVTDAKNFKSPPATFSETVSAAAVLKITPPAAQTATQGTSVSVPLGSFSQTGGTGPYKVDVNWGDGTPDTIVTLTAAGTIPANAHVFAKSGGLTVSEFVTDAKGNKSPIVTFIDTVKAVDPKTASISGRVFGDTNADGKIDNGEFGVGLWTVYLDLNNNGKFDSGEKTVTTDISGNWSITGLAAGTYTVRVVPVSGITATKPVGGVATITLAVGQVSTGTLFGEKSNA